MTPEAMIKPMATSTTVNSGDPAQNVLLPKRPFNILLRIAAQKQGLAFNSDNSVQNVPFTFGAGSTLRQDNISWYRLGVPGFKLHHVTTADEGEHTAPGDSQANVLFPLQSGSNQGHEFPGGDDHHTNPTSKQTCDYSGKGLFNVLP
jgi:hypothetical protein